MDSPNPYSQRSNFMDFLTSQQESHNSQPNPFQFFSQSTPAGSSSENPLFSTEAADDPPLDEEDRAERKRWSKAEDLVLISSWLNTSKDTVVSNEQRSKTFWKRIAAMYNGSPNIPADGIRESNHCKQRWRKINDHRSKFCGAFAAANCPPKSGFDDKDYLKLAHEIFLSYYKVKFMLEHAWHELKNEQKWCQLYSEKGVERVSSKRRKGNDGSAQSGSSQSVNDVEDGYAQSVEVRPPGIKAAKAKMKRAVNKTATSEAHAKKMENILTVWEIKQKDAALKAQQSEKSMLESLLARTVSELLSDLEIAIKNKLITEWLSKP